MFYLCVVNVGFYFLFFFFKQKTAYEMRISDWSSDVCSSDLALAERCVKEPRDVPAPAPEVGQVKEKLLAGGILDKFSEAYTEVDKQARQGKIAAEIGRASCRERVCQYV